MCRFCKSDEYIDKCNALLDDPDFQFAYDNIEGILDWIEDNDHVTERQMEAIDNIMYSVRK